MAEAWCRHRVHERGMQQLAVGSCGIAAVPGAPAANAAVTALANVDVQLGPFRSRCVDAAIVADASRLITMTSTHREQLVGRFPQAAEKSTTLLSYIGISGSISDPFGGHLHDYQECLANMQPAIEALLDDINGQGHNVR